LESKSKDLALIRLRTDLVRYAPDVGLQFGLAAEEEQKLAAEEQELMPEGAVAIEQESAA
jgi:UV DNA damage endonuclease